MTIPLKMQAIEVPANPAIFSFGFDKLVEILTLFCRTYPKKALVSVGCGLAILEREARAQVKNEFFLVDPEPNSFYPHCKNLHQVVVQVGMPATHSYTSELLETNPTLARDGQSILFLNWCDFGLNDYDLEAVQLLKPHAILAIIDKTESAGSHQFHHFLKTTQDYRVERLYSVLDPAKEKHICAHTTFQILWLSVLDKSSKKKQQIYIEECECLQRHDDSNRQNVEMLVARSIEKLDHQLLTHSVVENLTNKLLLS